MKTLLLFIVLLNTIREGNATSQNTIREGSATSQISHDLKFTKPDDTSSHFVRTLRAPNKLANKDKKLPAHTFKLTTSYPDRPLVFNTSYPNPSNEHDEEIIREHYFKGALIGFGSMVSFQAEPLSYTIDKFKTTHDGKGNKIVNYKKQWTRIPLAEHKNITLETHKEVTDLPFLEIEEKGWNIYLGDDWLHLLLTSSRGQKSSPFFVHNERGVVEQILILESPKGERIKLKFNISQKDKNGRQWVPAWSIHRPNVPAYEIDMKKKTEEKK